MRGEWIPAVLSERLQAVAFQTPVCKVALSGHSVITTAPDAPRHSLGWFPFQITSCRARTAMVVAEGRSRARSYLPGCGAARKAKDCSGWESILEEPGSSLEYVVAMLCQRVCIVGEHDQRAVSSQIVNAPLDLSHFVRGCYSVKSTMEE